MLKSTRTMIGLTSVMLLAGCSSPRKVLLTSKQPASIHYDAMDPYQLEVRDGHPLELFFSHTISPEYGHGVQIEITGETKVTDVTWRSDGVYVTFSLGHRLFVPKKSFIGGR